MPISHLRSMILSMSSIRWAGRQQLSIGLGAVFRLDAPLLGELVSHKELRQLWHFLLAAQVPLDNIMPRSTPRLMIYDRPLRATQGNATPALNLQLDTDADLSASSEIAYVIGNDQGKETRALVSPRPYGALGGGLTDQSATEPRERAGLRAGAVAESRHIRLPGLRARCFIEFDSHSGTDLRPLDTRIESVALFHHLGIGAVLYRAVTPEPKTLFDAFGCWESEAAPKTPIRHYFPFIQQGTQTLSPEERARSAYAIAPRQCASSQFAPTPTSAINGTFSVATPHMSSGSF